MKRISLVRHGESTWNAAKRWQGQSDAPLSGIGQGQARELARWFAEQRPDRVECSDLQRAAHTAALAGADARPDPAWREMFVGAWEGLFHHEVRDRFPEELAALRQGGAVKLGGGESWFDLRDRSLVALERLRDALPEDGHGIVFCHGGVVMAIVSAVLALPHRVPRRIAALTNTSVTELGFVGAEPRLLRYNDASHLADREPRARSGVQVVRLDTAAADEPRLARWPPTPDDPLDAVHVASPDAIRAYVAAALDTPQAAERLGAYTGPAHLQARADGVLVLVDYNLRASRRA